jgi:hypothetical protein
MSDRRYCSVEAQAVGEPLCATAPERDGVVLVPRDKRTWPELDAKAVLGAFPPDSELGGLLAGLSRPLLAAYQPGVYNQILVSTRHSKAVRTFGISGTAHGVLPSMVAAVCTDGRKDPCCAKFGMPVYRALCGVSDLVALEISHLGGCRFASTALFLPSGHCYGRLDQTSVRLVVEAERTGHLYPGTFRGILYGSELDCWTLSLWQERFGYVPPLEAISYTREHSGIRVRCESQPDSLVLQEKTSQLPLMSGCHHLSLDRSVERVSYEIPR